MERDTLVMHPTLFKITANKYDDSEAVSPSETLYFYVTSMTAHDATKYARRILSKGDWDVFASFAL